jgi:hypothetical protein
MTYSSGGLIQASDYNTIAWGTSGGGSYTASPNNLAYVWGTGSGRYGYGQTTTGFSALSASTTVTATQWTGVFGPVNSAASHQGVSAASLPSSVTAGTTITFLSATATALSNINGGVGSVSGALTDSAATTYTGAASWATSTTATHTVTFSSGDAARYFFNAGGKLKLSFSITATGSTRNAEWNDTATKCGTVTIGYLNTTQTPGAGAPAPTILLNANNGGYWNTTTGGVVHFKQFSDTAPYTTDYIQVTGTWSGTVANGGYPVLTLTTLWSNAYSNAFQQNVTQAAATSLVVSSPPTTYLSNTWGTPTVTGSATSV